MKKILGYIKSFSKNMVGSLDHSQEGFSQKKIMAYGFGLLVVFLHVCLWKYQFRIGNFTNLAYTLGADLTFLAACLGINYAHEKNITNAPDSSSTTEGDSTINPPKEGDVPSDIPK